MGFRRIAFPDLPWEPGAHPLERKKVGPGPVTLLEFQPGFADPNWCTSGHLIHVLGGVLELELQGSVQILRSGEACVLEPGTPHRAKNTSPEPVRLFVVSSG